MAACVVVRAPAIGGVVGWVRFLCSAGCLGIALILTASCSSDSGSDGGEGGEGQPAGGTSGGAGHPSGYSFAGGTGGNGGAVATAGSVGESGFVEFDGSIEDLRSASCTGTIVEAEPLSAVIEFVVDVSTSMNDVAPGSTRSKWEETRDALAGAIEAFPPSVNMGLLFYPNMDTGTFATPVDASQCVDTEAFVSIAPLGEAESAQRAALSEGLSGTSPAANAGTPTGDAYQLATAELGATTVLGKQFIVLITDGQPTYSFGCEGDGTTAARVDPQPIIDRIAAAKAQGITTFVIGSPGSEEATETGEDFRPSLSAAASAGGTATPGCSDEGPNYCHLDMTQEADFGFALRRALAQITGQVVACDYLIPPSSPTEIINLSKVNLIYTPGGGATQLIVQDSSSTCDGGWQYSTDQKQVGLCETTCDIVQEDPDGRIELLFGCDTLR